MHPARHRALHAKVGAERRRNDWRRATIPPHSKREGGKDAPPNLPLAPHPFSRLSGGEGVRRRHLKARCVVHRSCFVCLYGFQATCLFRILTHVCLSCYLRRMQFGVCDSYQVWSALYWSDLGWSDLFRSLAVDAAVVMVFAKSHLTRLRCCAMHGYAFVG